MGDVMKDVGDAFARAANRFVGKPVVWLAPDSERNIEIATVGGEPLYLIQDVPDATDGRVRMFAFPERRPFMSESREAAKALVEEVVVSASRIFSDPLIRESLHLPL